MDVGTYLRAIRKSWWLIVVAVLLGAGAGYGYSARATPVYAAHVSFNVITSANATTNLQSTDQYSVSTAVSLARVMSGDITAQAVKTSTGLRLDVNAIAKKITAVAELNTTVIDATVLDTSKTQALEIAAALGTQFPVVARDMQPTSSGGQQLNLVVTDFPRASAAPVSPRTKLNVALGAALGLVLGLLLAVIRLLRDTSVRTREDIETILGAPLVGDIGWDGSARSAPLVLERQARSVRAEAFRQLRTNLQFIDVDGALQVMIVTSPAEGEGKSTTATNLALMFAETGRSVLLVGADLRRPRVAQYLGLESAIGLTNVLANQIPLDAALQPWGVDGMSVLASGSTPPNPSELLGSSRMAEVITELRRRFDLIIIDTPPLLPVTDAAVLAAHADGVVVVTRHGRTRRAQLASAARALESVNAHVAGAVLNMRPARGPDSEGYGSYHYDDEPRRTGFLGRFLHRRGRPRHHVVAEPVGLPLPEHLPLRPPSAAAPVVAAKAGFSSRVGTRPDPGAVPDSAKSAFERRQARPARSGQRRLDPSVYAHGMRGSVEASTPAADSVAPESESVEETADDAGSAVLADFDVDDSDAGIDILIDDSPAPERIEDGLHPRVVVGR